MNRKYRYKTIIKSVIKGSHSLNKCVLPAFCGSGIVLGVEIKINTKIHPGN